MQSEVLNLILQAGELLLTSGAEVYRAEETMERMGRSLGYQVEAYVTPTGILVTVGKDEVYTTRIRRVRNRSQDLGKIIGVNAVSRELSNGNISISEAKQRLKELRGAPYNIFQRYFAVMVSSACLTFLLGGRQTELLIAALAGFVAYSSNLLLAKYEANSYLSGIVASFLVANFVYTAQILLPEISAPLVIVGGLMILVPGVAMASAVRDIVQGELLSGTSRAVEAMAIAATLASGSALALGLWRW